MKKNFAGWMAIGTPLLLGVGLLGAITLHMSARLPWHVLALPISIFVALQVLCYAAMFWVREHAGLRAGIGISGLYGLGTGLIIIHYGSRWGFLRGVADADCWWFAIAMVLATAIAAILMPRDKSGNQHAGAAK